MNNDSAELMRAIRELLDDIECYCADNVAVQEPCPVCRARSLMTAESSA